jgi:hypothetical protein
MYGVGEMRIKSSKKKSSFVNQKTLYSRINPVSIAFWQNIRATFNMLPVSLGVTMHETWLGLRDSWDTICFSTA